MTTADVLVVDADDAERAALGRSLRAAGCRVSAVDSAEAALYEQAQRAVDVVVTAIELGGMDGIELCRVLALQSPVALVVVDRRASGPSAVEALDAGADDVIGPDQIDELAARVKALVRRRRGSLRPRRRVRLGDLVAEWTPTGRLAAVDERYALSPAEGTLLEVLVERPGCVVPVEVLRRRLRDRHGPASAEALETTLLRLGDRLVEAGANRALQHIPDSGWLLAS